MEGEEPGKFYAGIFTDINAPLSNAVISVGGEKFPFENAPSCLSFKGHPRGACTMRYPERSEIAYLAAVENATSNKTYQITLTSAEQNASINYTKG
jgi:hypothetical protein